MRPTIRTILLACALLLTAAGAAAGQGHDHHAPAATAAPAMRTPCPLHLTTLNLTAEQAAALTAIRAAHMAEMKAVKARLGITADDPKMGPRLEPAMKASMARALAGFASTLDEAQQAALTAAVAAHTAEKETMKAAGQAHDCAACCKTHDGGHDAMAHEHPASATP